MGRMHAFTARPIAHRGLHDAGAGIIENTASAFRAAVASGFGIECDVQASADGEAMVHHDATLDRLTLGTGPLSAYPAAALRKVRFKAATDHMLTLTELCDLVAGRVPLLVEIKSGFDRDVRLTARVAEVLTSYAGPAAAMSFDPYLVAALRRSAPWLPRGIVAERWYCDEEWRSLSRATKRSLAWFGHWPSTRPDFVAYGIHDLPALAPLAARLVLRRPLLTWAVRTDEERRRAARWADQMIFEGFRPEIPGEPRARLSPGDEVQAS